MKTLNILLRLALIHLMVVGAYAQSPVVIQGVVTGGTTIKNVQVDSNGAIVLSGTITGGNGAASNTGAVVPAQASYTGAKVGANLAGITGTVVGGSTGLDVNIVGGAASGGTSSNFNAALPAAGTAIGASDGTNMQSPRIFDADSGAGTQYVLGVQLRGSGSGGSNEIGTASNPIRIDPTGTTSTPVTQATGSNLHTVLDSGTLTTLTTLTGTTTLTPGTCATCLGKAEDAASVSGDTGVFILGVAQATPTATAQDGDYIALKTNANGVLWVNDISVVAQGSTTSGQSGQLIQGAVTTSAPSYTTAQTAPLSLDTVGNLRVNAVGPAADGAAVSGFPVRIGGKDGSGNTQDIMTDTSGNLQVTLTGTNNIGTVSTVSAITPIGTLTDNKSTATDTSSVSAISLLKEISFQDQAIAAAITPIPTRCGILSTASTNSTSCKGSAGNMMGFRVVNTTATLYYLRLYNLATAPTCSSATGFVESIPIPASTSGAGIVAIEPLGEAYSTGVGYCLTGGSGSTDNTNAATGVFGAVLYN